MRVLPAADHRTMAWKNGGGETTEIIVHPEAAGFDDFLWRVSMARVAADGPFSVFPGIDRTLSVIEGDGIELVIGEAVPVRLTRDAAPLAFPADVPATARLVDGPIRDLNVMSRRDHVRHAVASLTIGRDLDLRVDDTTLLLVTEGGVDICDGPKRQSLSTFDAVLCEEPAGLRLTAKSGLTHVFAITFYPA